MGLDIPKYSKAGICGLLSALMCLASFALLLSAPFSIFFVYISCFPLVILALESPNDFLLGAGLAFLLVLFVLGPAASIGYVALQLMPLTGLAFIKKPISWLKLLGYLMGYALIIGIFCQYSIAFFDLNTDQYPNSATYLVALDWIVHFFGAFSALSWLVMVATNFIVLHFSISWVKKLFPMIAWPLTPISCNRSFVQPWINWVFCGNAILCYFAQEPFLSIFYNIAIILLIPFALRGIVEAHFWVKTSLGGIWLILLYIILLFLPFAVIPLLLFGIVQEWIPFVRQKTT
jgi:hypothetical protein